MDRSAVLYLITKNRVKDAINQYVTVEDKKMVFGSISSISQSEFFEAGRSGFNPSSRVSMFKWDYDGQDAVEVDGVRYAVYRTYVRRTDKIELYLQKEAGA